MSKFMDSQVTEERFTEPSSNNFLVTWKNILWWCGIFILPIIVLFVILWKDAIYPFGQQSFLTADLKNQYFDFYAWFQRVLSGDASLFYSLGQNGGNNSWGVFSYYLASPFNLLVAFFPKDRITDFVILITALRFGCMQVSWTWYLQKRFQLHRFWSVLFALSFVWGSWSATNVRNTIWTDALILLPMVMYGVWCLVTSLRWKNFSLALALLICSNWYMGYMTVFFLLFFFLFELYWAKKSLSYAYISQAILRFFSAMGIALCCDSWIFVPSVAQRIPSWSNRYSAGILIVLFIMLGICVFITQKHPGKLESERTGKVLLILYTAGVCLLVFYIFSQVVCSKIFGTQPELTTSKSYIIRGFIPFMWEVDRVPQLFCSTLVNIFIIIFFINRTIPRRQRLIVGAMTAALLLFVISRTGEYIWCGFRVPHGFYSRPALFVSVFFIWIAAASCSMMQTEFAHRFAYKRFFNVVPIVQALLAMVLFSEVLFVSAYEWVSLYGGYTQPGHDAYIGSSETSLTSILTRQSNDAFWRLGKTFTRSFLAAQNEGMAQGYATIQSYTSSSSRAPIDLYTSLGHGRFGSFWDTYENAYPLVDSLFGIRYVASDVNVPSWYIDTGITEITDQGNTAHIYENPYALGFGYPVSEDILSYQVGFDPGESIGSNQARYLSAVLGKKSDIYTEITPNVVSQTADNAYQFNLSLTTDDYVYVDTDCLLANPIVTVDGTTDTKNGWFVRTGMVYVGSAGMHTITVSADGLTDPSLVKFYAIDAEKLKSELSSLAKHQLTTSVYEDGHIVASGTYDKEQLVLLNVPYDSGWKVTINGEKSRLLPAADGAVSAVWMPAGTSTLELTYMSPGFIAGCITSGISLLSLLVVYIVRKRKSSQFV